MWSALVPEGRSRGRRCDSAIAILRRLPKSWVGQLGLSEGFDSGSLSKGMDCGSCWTWRDNQGIGNCYSATVSNIQEGTTRCLSFFYLSEPAWKQSDSWLKSSITYNWSEEVQRVEKVRFSRFAVMFVSFAVVERDSLHWFRWRILLQCC